MQIRAFRPDEKTQKKYLEVVRTCANRQSEATKANASPAAMGDNAANQGESNSTISGIFGQGLQTGYFILSTFTLNRMVF